MLSNSMVPMVGIVDTAVMGRMGAPEWIAATAVGAILFSSIYWVFGFLRMGTGGLVAQAYGAGKLQEAGQVTVRAMGIAIVLGALLILLQVPLLKLGLAALEDSNDWKALTATYFSVRILSAPATLTVYVLLGTLIGLQKMTQVLILQFLLNLLNVALTIALFAYTSLGIAGVAWATVISEYTTLFAGLFMLRKVLAQALSNRPLNSWLWDLTAARRYFSISGNLFIRTLCLTLAFYWMTVLGSRISVGVLAVNTVLLHLVHFASYCMDGYAHAIESLTGYAVGKRSQMLFKRAVKAAIELAVITALAFAVAYLLAGEYLVSLMTTESSVQELAKTWLPWVILAPVTGIASFLLDGIFIGATRTAEMRNGMLISLLVFAIASVALVPTMGNHGVWLSYHILLIVRAITLIRYWPSLNIEFADTSR